jgi:hypothetical protein
VAKSVARFITVGAISSHCDNFLTGSFQERQGRQMKDGDPVWAVGPHGIEANNLVLVRLDHVSKGSWQAHLQLIRPRL